MPARTQPQPQTRPRSTIRVTLQASLGEQAPHEYMVTTSEFFCPMISMHSGSESTSRSTCTATRTRTYTYACVVPASCSLRATAPRPAWAGWSSRETTPARCVGRGREAPAHMAQHMHSMCTADDVPHKIPRLLADEAVEDGGGKQCRGLERGRRLATRRRRRAERGGSRAGWQAECCLAGCLHASRLLDVARELGWWIAGGGWGRWKRPCLLGGVGRVSGGEDPALRCAWVFGGE
eukprot:scaffold24698_cov63-Phaeocystis_antarctica.AAC.2